MTGSVSPLLGTVLQGTYKVERLIGEGGMGCVFEASHLRVRRRFAIKVLAGAAAHDQEALARFRREAEITGELGHPNIVEVIDFNFTDDGAPFLVMELLNGEALDRRMARSPRLPLPLATTILEQTASALEAAHGRGVIHRDLKPQNIFLVPGPYGEVVKILDFGISKVLGSRSVVTGTFALLGTPNYMSPEQAEGRNAEVDARTDIFALGAILYEMLGGQPAFSGDSVPSILYQVVHQEPVQLKELRPDLPAGAVAAVCRALSKSKEGRQASARELAREFVAGLEAVEARDLACAATAAQMPVVQRDMVAPGPAGAAVVSAPASGSSLASPRPLGTTMSSGAGELVEAPRGSEDGWAGGAGLARRALGRRAILLMLGGGLIGSGGAALYLFASGAGSGRGPASAGAGSASGSASQQTVAARPTGSAPGAPEPDVRTARAAPADAAAAARAADLRRPGRDWARLRMVVRLSEDPLDTSWAHVYLDGRKIEDAPFERRVAAGAHQIEVRRPGYRTVARSVTLAPGSLRTIAVQLEKR